MSKKVIIASVVVVLLGVALVATRKGPQTEATGGAWSVNADDSVDRLELADGELTAVYAKAEDGWRQVEPVDALAAQDAFEEVEAIFAAGIQTDLSVPLDSKDASHGLSREHVVHVRALAGDRVVAEFAVGASVTVPNTNAQRTWLLPEGSSLAYRAWSPAEGSDLHRTFGRDLQEWRERRVLRLARSEIDDVTLEGAGPTVRLVAEGPAGPGADGSPAAKRSFAVVEPVGVTGDPAAISALLTTLSSLRVERFADGAVADEVGLEPPARTLRVKTATRELVIEVGARVEDGPEPEQAPDQGARYLRVSGEPFVYMVAGSTATSLMRRLGELRDKTVWTLAAANVAEVRVRGADAYTLRRDGAGWALSVDGPDGAAVSQELDPAKATELLNALIGLRAVAFEDDDADPAWGLDDDGAYSVTVVLSDGAQHTLTLGATTADADPVRYARVDAGLTFTMRSYTAADVMKTITDLVTSPAPTGDALTPQ